MSTTTTSASDPLSRSLHTLVRQGTLSPAEASELRIAADARMLGHRPPRAASWSLGDRMRAAVTALAGALAFAVVGIGAEQSDGEFMTKAFLVMVGVAIALGIAAAVWHLALTVTPHSRWTASVLGAFAIKSLGVAFLASWGDKDAVPYLVGLGMIALGAAGYWYLEGTAFAFAAFVGGLVVAVEFADFVVGDSDGPLMYGVILLFYGLIVAAAGWRFECRHITGMLGAGVALYGFYNVSTSATYALSMGSAVPGIDDSAQGGPDYEGDLQVALVLTLAICLALAALYAHTHFVGYVVLASIGAVVIPGYAMLGLAQEHPIRWGALILGGIAGLLAVLAMVDQGRRSGFEPPTWLRPQPVTLPPDPDEPTDQDRPPPDGPPPAPPSP